MIFLIPLAKMLFAQMMVFATPCDVGAAHVLSTLQNLKITAVAYRGDELEMKIEGNSLCNERFEMGIEIDQAEAKSLLSYPAVGEVLFARTRVEGDRAYVRFTGAAQAVRGLTAEWAAVGNLRRFVKSVTSSWFANYLATAIIQRADEIGNLRSACMPGLTAAMSCGAFAGWTFTTAPACMSSLENRDRLAAAVDLADPFLAGRESRVNIAGVARDLCGNAGLRAPWIQAAASDLIFGPRQAYDRKEARVLSQIQIRGDVQW